MLYHGRCYSSLSKLPVLIWVLNYGNVAQLARFFEVCQIFVKNHIILEILSTASWNAYRSAIRVYQAQTCEVLAVISNSLNQLVHRSYSATRCNHTDSRQSFAPHLFRLWVSYLEFASTMVRNIAADSCNLHTGITFLHFVNVLGEKTSLLVLKVPKVNFD